MVAAGVKLSPFLMSTSMLPNARLIEPLTAVNTAELPPPSSDGIVILNPALYPVPESVT